MVDMCLGSHLGVLPVSQSGGLVPSVSTKKGKKVISPTRRNLPFLQGALTVDGTGEFVVLC